MAQNWSLEQLIGECGEILEQCSAHAGEVTFEFPDGRKPVALLNWPALLEAIEGGDAAAEERAAQLHQNNLSEHAAEQVDRDRWVPFGVVRDAGMLFFDLLAVHKGQPTVLWEDPSQKCTELGLADAFFKTLQA
jgi:hypothetical protein